MAPPAAPTIVAALPGISPPANATRDMELGTRGPADPGIPGMAGADGVVVPFGVQGRGQLGDEGWGFLFWFLWPGRGPPLTSIRPTGVNGSAPALHEKTLFRRRRVAPLENGDFWVVPQGFS